MSDRADYPTAIGGEIEDRGELKSGTGESRGPVQTPRVEARPIVIIKRHYQQTRIARGPGGQFRVVSLSIDNQRRDPVRLNRLRCNRPQFDEHGRSVVIKTKDLLEHWCAVQTRMAHDQPLPCADSIVERRKLRLDKRMRRILCREQARTRWLQDDAGGCADDPPGRIDGEIVNRASVQMNLKNHPPIARYHHWAPAINRDIGPRNETQHQNCDEEKRQSQLNSRLMGPQIAVPLRICLRRSNNTASRRIVPLTTY